MHCGMQALAPSLSTRSAAVLKTLWLSHIMNFKRVRESKKAVGTLFITEGGWSYDIQPYLLFPDEAEILLEPERQFKVTSVIKGDLTVINLEMLNTPLPLPNMFGSEW